MVRVLVGSALLVSTLGLAAAFVGPSLSAAPNGEAMVVRGAAVPELHQARFDASDCVPALLLDGAAAGTHPADLI